MIGHAAGDVPDSFARTHEGNDVGKDEIALFGDGAWKGNKTPLHVVITDDAGYVVEQTDETDEE